MEPEHSQIAIVIDESHISPPSIGVALPGVEQATSPRVALVRPDMGLLGWGAIASEFNMATRGITRAPALSPNQSSTGLNSARRWPIGRRARSG